MDSPEGKELQRLVKEIESFAPTEYRIERAEYYYNYATIEKYMNPLLALLRLISKNTRQAEMGLAQARELFFALKRFWDVNSKVSMYEAAQDNRFLLKYKELFSLFYGKAAPSHNAIADWLESIRLEFKAQKSGPS